MFLDTVTMVMAPYLELAHQHCLTLHPYVEPMYPYIEPTIPYLNSALNQIHNVTHIVNTYCVGIQPWQLILYTIGFTLLINWVISAIFDSNDSLKTRISKWVFRTIRRTPIIGTMIRKEMERCRADMEKGLFPMEPGTIYHNNLPETGFTAKEIMNEIDSYTKTESIDWEGGKASGAVYGADYTLRRLMAQVFEKFIYTNPLHPDIFPYTRRMEAELVRMCCNMFNGGPKTCGTMTIGGTESIMMACKAYRGLAYSRGIKLPEIIICVSSHAAFLKAGHYFCMKIVEIPEDPQTQQLDLHAMKRAINKNTCMLVASAPPFTHGTIDPVEAVSKLGLQYGVPVHVDCCLGGFLLPFAHRAGFPDIPHIDFTLPGVTSISCDSHKYGYSPKGSSIVMYRDKSYIHHQYFTSPNWAGGIYCTPTMPGSRAGALISTTWTAMMYYGESGYIESTRKIITTTRKIATAMRNVKGLIVLGDPKVCVVAITSKEYNIFTLSNMLHKRGWLLNPLQFPSAVHICVTLLHTESGVADKFIQDVQECATELRNNPVTKAEGMAAIYGTSQIIPDRSIVTELSNCFLDACYKTN